ncbi:FliH/SctL family protein [Limobrevibacterium gyesilva]|uniref:Flagellar assembly protein FliH/Type III secretion system HrpE domain-containing protein n=1 Tax=Limobrevibacterium gyesilva TaxID=2991712 RepID=A0AA41YHB5_9PROT|nr:hypothetical protein [Limobrevibacterium gyesilva]MCW3473286.1 hypothetical protein [Limobrevibacterium gyesilva]
MIETVEDLIYDDFDNPPEVPADDTPESQRDADPASDLAFDLDALRQEAYAAGLRDGAVERSQERLAASARTVGLVMERLTAVRRDIDDAASATAESIASVVFAVLLQAFPATYARSGSAEVAHFSKRILPLLRFEPDILVQVACGELPAAEQIRADVPTDLRRRVRVEVGDDLQPGDVRISWQDGQTRRTGASLQAHVIDLLRELGLTSEAPVSIAAVSNSDVM